jgi:hypothetical protein
MSAWSAFTLVVVAWVRLSAFLLHDTGIPLAMHRYRLRAILTQNILGAFDFRLRPVGNQRELTVFTWIRTVGDQVRSRFLACAWRLPMMGVPHRLRALSAPFSVVNSRETAFPSYRRSGREASISFCGSTIASSPHFLWRRE